jgi:cell shape-determining protein MreD
MKLRALWILAPLTTAFFPPLQATFLFRALPGGITLDCLQLLIWVAALRGGMLAALWSGFWGGLWMDVAVGGPLGPNLIFYTLLGWLIGFIGELQPNPKWRELALWGALTPVVALFFNSPHLGWDGAGGPPYPPPI